MLPDAALHQLLETPHQGGMRARVVQHDNGAVLDVVQPPLGRDVKVLSKFWPQRPGGDSIGNLWLEFWLEKRTEIQF